MLEITAFAQGIPLDLSVPERLKDTVQAQAYDAGLLPLFKLDGIYAFVIQETNQLEMTLGLCSHFWLSGKATQVRAAGEIHYSKGIIIKITDQSGSYHLSLSDPAYAQKRQAALEAMQNCGLPMNKFQSFQEPLKEPLVFGGPAPIPRIKAGSQESKTPRPYKAVESLAL